MILRTACLVGNENCSAAEFLEEESFLKEQVIERLCGRDVLQADINLTRLGKRLPVEDDVEIQLIGERANQLFEIAFDVNNAKLLLRRSREILRLGAGRRNGGAV